jgi:hypothetical protein
MLGFHRHQADAEVKGSSLIMQLKRHWLSGSYFNYRFAKQKAFSGQCCLDGSGCRSP